MNPLHLLYWVAKLLLISTIGVIIYCCIGSFMEATTEAPKYNHQRPDPGREVYKMDWINGGYIYEDEREEYMKASIRKQSKEYKSQQQRLKLLEKETKYLRKQNQRFEDLFEDMLEDGTIDESDYYN